MTLPEAKKGVEKQNTHRSPCHSFRLLILLVFMLGAFQCQNNRIPEVPQVSLTEEEHVWLDSHPVITIAPDPHFPPIEYFDEDGNYSGISADYIHLLEKKLGIRFKVVRYSNWEEINQKARDREVDILCALSETTRRNTFLTFTQPLFVLPAVIIVRNAVQEDLTLNQLNGMRIAAASHSIDQEYLEDHFPDLDLDLVPTIQTGLRKVSFGMSDAMVTNLAAATYHIEKQGITNLRLSGEADYSHQFSMGIRKDWPVLRNILNKALKSIQNEEKEGIYKKWIRLDHDGWMIWQKFLIYLIVIAGIALLIISSIITWNRSLKKQVSQRTEELQKELVVRLEMEKELFQSEEKYRRLTENTNDIVYSYNLQGIVIYIGPQVKKYGYDPEEIISNPFIDFIYPDDMKKVMEDFKKTVDMGVEFPTELRIQSKDKKIYWFEEKGKIQRDHRGDPVMISGVLRDITQRKHAEDRLKATLAEKEVLLKEVYHRVKNNLQVISSLLGLQAESITNKKFRSMFQNSRDRVDSMALIHQKLYQSQDLDQVELSAYIRSLAIHLFETYRSDTSRVSLHFDMDDILLSVDLAVPCGLIVNELISNALKYAFPQDKGHEGKIQVSLHSKGRSLIELILKDNGIGLPDDFEIHKTESLGLRLVHILTQDQLHGQLSVTGKKGTTFKIQFKTI